MSISTTHFPEAIRLTERRSKQRIQSRPTSRNPLARRMLRRHDEIRSGSRGPKPHFGGESLTTERLIIRNPELD